MITAAVVPFRAGNTNANTKWQAIINSAPKMSIVAPLPRWSRKFPKMGVIAAAPKVSGFVTIDKEALPYVS